MHESRYYNKKRLVECASKPLKVGDTVILRANERITFTNYFDPQYEVFRKRGIIDWIENQLTGIVKIVNRSKLLLVDPNISWDHIAVCPRRNLRKGMRLDATLKITTPVIPTAVENPITTPYH